MQMLSGCILLFKLLLRSANMASAGTDPVLGLQEEALCPICLESYRDPVSVECGHSFCRSCINRSWRGLQSNFPCPHCRKVSRWKKLRPNRQLANMAELAGQIARQEGDRCSRHREPLRLYCEDDQQPLCLVCRESWDHRAHTVVPLEETTQDYKISLLSRLTPLRKEVDEIQKRKLNEEKTMAELMNKVGTERQKLTSQFAELRQVVDLQEKVFLNRLEEAQKAIEMAATATMTKLDEKLASLNKLIMEIEKSGIRQAVGLLQNAVDSLSREKDPICQEAVPDKQKNSRQTGHKSLNSSNQQINNFKVSFTLDQRTASPQLIVSRDRKSVKFTDTPQNFPDIPERFNGKPCVVGSRGFTSGRRYWEVDVGGGIYWTVGVAKQSVRRKGPFKISPDEGIWAIGLLGMFVDQYWAFTRPDTPLAVGDTPQKIGVYLDYEQDHLSFYNADSMYHIFTFTCDFNEKVLPFFCVGALGTEITL